MTELSNERLSDIELQDLIALASVGGQRSILLAALELLSLRRSPSLSGGEVVAWRGGKEDGSRKYTEIKRVSEIWADQGLTIIPLVRQSVLIAADARANAAVEALRPFAEVGRMLSDEDGWADTDTIQLGADPEFPHFHEISAGAFRAAATLNGAKP